MSRRDFFRHAERRQYRTRDHENPYFRRVKKIPWKALSLFVGTTIVFLGFLTFLLAHPALAIHEVQIDGLTHIDREEFQTEVSAYLHERVLLFFHRKNQFLFSDEDLRKKLEKKFTFASLTVSQEGKKLSIHVEERNSNLIWMTDQEYIVDVHGVVVRRLNREDAAEANLASFLPSFYDINKVPVTVGSTVLTEQEIERVFAFHKILSEQGIGFTQTRLNRLVGGWMSVVTQEGYEIYFDVTGDIEAQGEALKMVLAEQIEDPGDLEYIDVRFGDHVYFK
ncbi:hypothetical protein HZA87_01135 [Candidatus Uhrbacteria bacterium]|nr:hypothetical protein [Candidatus Uhrbacteria bacterium]